MWHFWHKRRDWSHILYSPWNATLFGGLWQLSPQWMDVTCSGGDQVGEHGQAPVIRFSLSPCFISQWGNEFTEQQLSFPLSFPVLFLMVYFMALWFSITKMFQQAVYTAHFYYIRHKCIPNVYQCIPKCSLAAASLPWPTARLKHNGFKLCRPTASFLPLIVFYAWKEAGSVGKPTKMGG